MSGARCNMNGIFCVMPILGHRARSLFYTSVAWKAHARHFACLLCFVVERVINALLFIYEYTAARRAFSLRRRLSWALIFWRGNYRFTHMMRRIIKLRIMPFPQQSAARTLSKQTTIFFAT